MADDQENDVVSSEEEEEESSTSEDDEFVDESTDRDFFKTLSCLKSKDPQIYNSEVKFFSEKQNDEAKCMNKKEKPMFLRDYERKLLTENAFDEKSSEGNLQELSSSTDIEKPQKLKIIDSEDSSDDDSDLLIEKTPASEKEEQDELNTWLQGAKNELKDKKEELIYKPLKEFWNDPALNEKEEFLKDYFLNKRWKTKEKDEYIDSNLSEDSDDINAQEEFEMEYNNLRHEGKEPKRYPRTVEGSLRRKNDTRKRKRAEVLKRKQAEKEKKRGEIKKAQKEKIKEIQQMLEKLKEATGNETLAFADEDILGEFDPDAHDKKMNDMYGDDFYSKEEDCEKPNFDSDGNECDPQTTRVTRAKRKKERKRKKKKPNSLDLSEVVNPQSEQYKKYSNELLSMDCEDFIDDIPCKFKYREVVPNDYGLTIEEILAADDADLNRWVPTEKIYKQQPAHVEKNEVKIYKKKASDINLKAKLMPSLFKTESDKEEGPENETAVVAKQEVKLQEGNKKKKNKRFKSVKHPTDDISDNRLLAYDIKPRQFRAKIKYSKT